MKSSYKQEYKNTIWFAQRISSRNGLSKEQIESIIDEMFDKGIVYDVFSIFYNQDLNSMHDVYLAMQPSYNLYECERLFDIIKEIYTMKNFHFFLKVILDGARYYINNDIKRFIIRTYPNEFLEYHCIQNIFTIDYNNLCLMSDELGKKRSTYYIRKFIINNNLDRTIRNNIYRSLHWDNKRIDKTESLVILHNM